MFKRRTWTIEEINVWREKYGHKIRTRELLGRFVIAFLALYVMSYILYRYWWLSVIYGLIGILGTYLWVLPAEARRVYEMQSYRERDRFTNTFTQMIKNPARSFLSCLNEIASITLGELGQQLTTLTAKLRSVNEKEGIAAVDGLKKQYKKDISFVHYLEQLATIFAFGRINTDVLDQITRQHNEVLVEREIYIEEKRGPRSELLIMLFMTFFAFFVLSYVFTLQNWINLYSHRPIGWFCNTLYFVYIGLTFRIFFKNYVNDEVEEIKY
ncbi:MAG: hypothetical protein ABF969_03390 [Sporolactobacillus sp.]